MISQTSTADMGYTKTGDMNTCNAFYKITITPYVAVWYPTYGGTSYWELWHTIPAFYNNVNPFQYAGDPPYVDWYVLSLRFANAGSTNATATTMDSTLSNLLFGSSQGSLNFVRDESVAQQGPMDVPLAEGNSALLDLAFEVDGANPTYAPNTNPIGLPNYNICSVSQFSAVRSGSGTQPSGLTSTSLTVASSAVLGRAVPMQAKVVANASSAAPAGRVQFRDGSAVLATVSLDATGSASYMATGLQLGGHNLAAYFISADNSQPSDSGSQLLTIYADSPDMQLTLSQSTLNVSYGQPSSPVSLSVLASSGMNGTVS